MRWKVTQVVDPLVLGWLHQGVVIWSNGPSVQWFGLVSTMTASTPRSSGWSLKWRPTPHNTCWVTRFTRDKLKVFNFAVAFMTSKSKRRPVHLVTGSIGQSKCSKDTESNQRPFNSNIVILTSKFIAILLGLKFQLLSALYDEFYNRCCLGFSCWSALLHSAVWISFMGYAWVPIGIGHMSTYVRHMLTYVVHM